MVSESQGPRENWDRWKTRGETKVIAILPEVNFFSLVKFSKSCLKLQNQLLEMNGKQK